MALYPSLEDMCVDKMAQVQVAVAQHQALTGPAGASAAYAGGSGLYAGLGLEEMSDYGGLDLSPAAIQRYLPPDVAAALVPIAGRPGPDYQPLATITPRQDLGMVRAEVKAGVREVILAKDQAGKLGVAVQPIDKGLFVAFVWRDSAASMAGLRFGDQILQIDGQCVAGWSMDKALKVLKEAKPTRVSFAVRDRPFARTVTVVKDATNHVGFVFNKGEITAIVKDTSAARNGLLINHQLMEVNGQNVIGLDDKDLQRIIAESPRSVTLTIMPTFVYEHLIKGIGFKKIKQFMDHSIPEA